MILVITGAPGAGKTTLANHLAAGLGRPLVAKDDIKEALFDVMGTPPDRVASRRVGIAAIGVMLALARRAAQANADVILECNFRRGQGEVDLRSLMEMAEVRLVHCQVADEVTLERYRRRLDRHLGHHDDQALPDLVKGLNEREFDPLRLDVRLLVVDTTDGYQPGLEEIIAFGH